MLGAKPLDAARYAAANCGATKSATVRTIAAVAIRALRLSDILLAPA